MTDKLRSYLKPIRNLAHKADRRAHKGLNNRISAISYRHARKDALRLWGDYATEMAPEKMTIAAPWQTHQNNLAMPSKVA